MTRSRTRFGLVWLTLVAFSAQLAVAVLHHHHYVARGPGMAARAITASLCGPASRRLCSPAQPQRDSDGCVFCWAAAVAANTLEPPPLPQIPLPQIVVGERVDAIESTTLKPVHRDQFQARGPPSIEAA
jgi:hypothetical protein